MANRPSIEHFNETLKKAEARAWELEQRLVNILKPILDEAGNTAARRFEEMATDHLAASAAVRDCGYLGADSDARGTVRSLMLTSAGRADGVTSTSTMIAIKPRPDEADRLVLPDGTQEPESLHITLAFLGDYEGDLADIADALTTVAGTHAPLEGVVGGIGQFADNGKGHPVILLPSVPGLVELRVDVTDALTRAGIDYGREHGYQPHMTVSYSADGLSDAQGAPYGEVLHFDSLLIVRGDVEVVEVPFTGSKPLTASLIYKLFYTPPYDDVSLAAAGDVPNWTAPAGSEIVDVPGLVASLRTKTDPVRLATIETTMKSSLEGVGIDYDVTNPFTAKVLTQTGSQITEIGKTTQLNVMRIVKESYNQGLSIPDTAKAIKVGMTGDASTKRATLIARTELAGAVNGGSLAATQIFQDATGEAYNKQWLTSPGAQYPRHEDYDGLDGQTTTLDGFFDVGGDQLQFPGDPAGSPDEVCNCRCTMVYEDAHGGDVAQTDADQGDLGLSAGEADGGGATGDGEDIADVEPQNPLADMSGLTLSDSAPLVDHTAEALTNDAAIVDAAATPPPDRPFSHYAEATLKTQIYRSKVAMRDLLVKTDPLTLDEQTAYAKHEARLKDLLFEKRFRERGDTRPFAHYVDVTLKTQIYRTTKTITDLNKVASERLLTPKELDDLHNANAKLTGLVREQELRAKEEDLGVKGKKPPKPSPNPKPKPATTTRPPEAGYDDGYAANLSKDEIQAVGDYTGYGHMGQGYVSINNYLRGQWNPGGADLEQIKSRVALLDSAIEKADPLTGERTVYRAFSTPPDVHVGSVLNSDGFMSTSGTRDLAESWAGTHGDIYEIHVPEGMNALNLQRSVPSYLQNPNEKEFLLPRGTKLVVDKITDRVTVYPNGNRVVAHDIVAHIEPIEKAAVTPARASLDTPLGRLQNAYANRPTAGKLEMTSLDLTRIGAKVRDKEMVEFEAQVRAVGKDFADEVEARTDAQLSAGFKTTQEKALIRRDAVLSLLREVRETGPDATHASEPYRVASGSNGAVKKLAADASQFYPRDWVEHVYENGNTVLYKRVKRGYYRSYDYRTGYSHIAVSGGIRTIRSDADGFSTMTHEIAHMMEKNIPAIRQLEAVFYNRRTAGELTRPYRVNGKSYYDERVRPDDFTNEYMGKDYHHATTIGELPNDEDSFELLSTGMEGVFNGEYALWEDDPDMRNFILGMLVSV